MPAAPTVGGAEVGDGPFKHFAKLFGQFALAPARPGDGDRSEHVGFCGQVINVPSQRFAALAVPFQPGREIPLGASHIEIDPFSKEEASELAHRDVPGF